jgi:hypothetical protein
MTLQFGPHSWARFFFANSGYSWWESTDAPPEPTVPGVDARFVAIDLANAHDLAGRQITLADLSPRGAKGARLLLGFDSGAMLSLEHDGEASHFQIIPPAA